MHNRFQAAHSLQNRLRMKSFMASCRNILQPHGNIGAIVVDMLPRACALFIAQWMPKKTNWFRRPPSEKGRLLWRLQGISGYPLQNSNHFNFNPFSQLPTNTIPHISWLPFLSTSFNHSYLGIWHVQRVLKLLSKHKRSPVTVTAPYSSTLPWGGMSRTWRPNLHKLERTYKL